LRPLFRLPSGLMDKNFLLDIIRTRTNNCSYAYG
jgi:hypothetical protein